jgi:hypothetical protein
MKHLSKIALTALTVGSLATSLVAQEDARPRRGGMMLPPVLRVLDIDRDGSLSAAEIAAAPTALLKLDADQNGALSPEELQPQRPGNAAGRPQRPEGEGRGPRGDMPGRAGGHPLIAALDADKNGTIDSAEIANSVAALKALDKNADGSVTLDEVMPARGEGREGGPRGPRGPRDAAVE